MLLNFIKSSIKDIKSIFTLLEIRRVVLHIDVLSNVVSEFLRSFQQLSIFDIEMKVGRD